MLLAAGSVGVAGELGCGVGGVGAVDADDGIGRGPVADGKAAGGENGELTADLVG